MVPVKVATFVPIPREARYISSMGVTGEEAGEASQASPAGRTL